MTGPNPPLQHVVLVLSFNGKLDTLACVASLVEGSPEAHVVVIDNGSFDGTLEEVASRWPAVTILQTGGNLGFTGGMNHGLRWALARGAAAITVLNNDTVVPPGAMAALRDDAMGGEVAVTPEIRYADGSERVWFGGGAIDPDTNLAHHLSMAELSSRVPDSRGVRPTEVLTGCCITASADTWRRVGLFDERYFLNFEDSEWSVRAVAAGVSLVVDPRVVIHHAVSASFTGPLSYLGTYYYARNGVLFGRRARGGSLAETARFLRRHVAPELIGRVKRHQWEEASRRLLVIGVALSDHARGRYGQAPRWLAAKAVRWAAEPSQADLAPETERHSRRAAGTGRDRRGGQPLG
jgi:GT2 family glycosyltransferase